MQVIQCTICHDPIRVPVRFTCFPCVSTPGKPSCHSIARVCLLCAREYLQLNIPRHERIYTRKCLTCQAVVHPPSINASSAYEKDYLLMQLDIRQDITCFRMEQGCPFKGSQLDLDQHQQHLCNYRNIHCEFCHIMYKANQEHEHKSQCPGYYECDLCKQYLLSKDRALHLSQIHHRKECPQCHQLLIDNEAILEKHMTDICIMRNMECPLCLDYMNFQSYKSHLDNHLMESIQKIQNANRIIKNETEQVLKWFQIRTQLS